MCMQICTVYEYKNAHKICLHTLKQITKILIYNINSLIIIEQMLIIAYFQITSFFKEPN